ncbi:MAG: outer membrane phospholipase A [Crocinitomicaceae bacterium]|jgi:outer membrane phospholipase A
MVANIINEDGYTSFDAYVNNLKNIQPKLQICLKVTLNYDSMFVEIDTLYFGVTTQAWWQIYADKN